MKKILISLLLLVLALGSMLGGYALASVAVNRMEDMRHLERLPRSSVSRVLPGAVSLRGTARESERHGLVSAPESGTPSLFYRRTVERRSTDSDGRIKWSTVPGRTQRDQRPFILEDETGSLLVDLTRGSPSTRAEQRFRTTRNSERFTEYRIEPGDELFVVGHAVIGETGHEIHFDQESSYPMLVSCQEESSVLSYLGAQSIALVFFGLLLMTGGVTLVFWSQRHHNSIAYVFSVGLVSIGVLSWLSLCMIERDLINARNSAEETSIGAAKEWATVLGIQEPASLNGAVYVMSAPLPDDIDAVERERLSHLRVEAARRLRRTNAQRSTFPENLIASVRGVAEVPDLELTREETGLLEELESSALNPKIRSQLWWLFVLAVGGIGYGLSRLGISIARKKRRIEGLPISSAESLREGLNKVIGRARPLSQEHVKRSPFTNTPCVWYNYKVIEGRGKSSFTVKEDRFSEPFLLEDEHGSLVRIDLQQTAGVLDGGQEILEKDYSDKTKGKYRTIEKRIEVGAHLMVVGVARPPANLGEPPRLEQESPEPFIVSAIPEPELLFERSHAARWLLAFGVNLLALSGLIAVALLSGFSTYYFNLVTVFSLVWAIWVSLSLIGPSSRAPLLNVRAQSIAAGGSGL